MPAKSPDITVPTTRPRCSTGARSTAYGTIICTTEDDAPTSMLLAISAGTERDMAMSSSAGTEHASVVTTSERRSRASPSGTSKIIPSA